MREQILCALDFDIEECSFCRRRASSRFYTAKTQSGALPLSFDAVRNAHSITSSALSRSERGMVRPSALAVLRLIVSWYFVGC